MCFRIASERKNFFTSLAIWGCAIQIASHIAVASRDLGHQAAATHNRILSQHALQHVPHTVIDIGLPLDVGVAASP